MNTNLTIRKNNLHDFDRYHSNWNRIIRNYIRSFFSAIFRIK